METAHQIYDEDNVLRRVPTFLPNYVKPDGAISSLAFRLRNGENGLSVDLERLSSFSKATLGRSDFRLLKLNVGQIRNYINDGLDVISDPLEDNNAHSLITGNLTKGKQKQLVLISNEIFE
ncbi:MAG: hypothetical protein IPM47_14310 [Sphingobacteriales bacterium]|nr:MAG: hypothetical protein IPM47_14310 [Sphingobacteriales bacterium]